MEIQLRTYDCDKAMLALCWKQGAQDNYLWHHLHQKDLHEGHRPGLVRQASLRRRRVTYLFLEMNGGIADLADFVSYLAIFSRLAPEPIMISWRSPP